MMLKGNTRHQEILFEIKPGIPIPATIKLVIKKKKNQREMCKYLLLRGEKIKKKNKSTESNPCPKSNSGAFN